MAGHIVGVALLVGAVLLVAVCAVDWTGSRGWRK